jgi:hypothetical protein
MPRKQIHDQDGIKREVIVVHDGDDDWLWLWVFIFAIWFFVMFWAFW